MIPLQHGLSSVSFSLVRDVEDGNWFVESLDGAVSLGKFRMSFASETPIEDVVSPDFLAVLLAHLPVKVEASVKTVPGRLLETQALAIFDLRVMASIVVGAVQRVIVRVNKVAGNILELLSSAYRVDHIAVSQDTTRKALSLDKDDRVHRQTCSRN